MHGPHAIALYEREERRKAEALAAQKSAEAASVTAERDAVAEQKATLQAVVDDVVANSAKLTKAQIVSKITVAKVAIEPVAEALP